MSLNANRIREENPEGSVTPSVMCRTIKGKEAMKQHRIPGKSRQTEMEHKEHNVFCPTAKA